MVPPPLQESEAELKDKLPWQIIKPIRVTTFIPAEYCFLAGLTRCVLLPSGGGEGGVYCFLEVHTASLGCYYFLGCILTSLQG